ncbi:N-acetylneuraminate synthase family protein [Stappia sp. ES.058]|uniref:N-acetylneuraminate synthase family protein n=1 Tax=Stappia sp. ES.058 TaxID=1881061 RepID=UPI00087BBE80|nr:N-acetylneuraminate synthase family protein [Stappia sp. ES.058]SDU24515.1 N-acetylneuraminate synthase [Stappia sp. ES.058]
MIIERNVTPFVVFTDDTLGHALNKIGDNRSGLVFAVAQNGVLEGILTDGDFRRWLLGSRELRLDLPVSHAMNRDFVSASANLPPGEIAALFSERVDYVPLVDRQRRLVGLANRHSHGFSIDGRAVGKGQPVFVVAEIGNNHNGSLDTALRLIDAAHAAGADCVKFQMRDIDSLYGTVAEERRDLGAQYTLDLLKRFQLTPDALFAAFEHARQAGIIPLCTPWDEESLAALEGVGLAGYKVASADLTNHDLLSAIARTRKPLIASTGMSNEAEIVDAVRVMRECGAAFALLHCNSTYPAPAKDVNLAYMERLGDIGRGCPIGYSGHERGIAVAIAAAARGASIIEKHFTFDRSQEGNDHRVSLLPGEFAEMVAGIRDVEAALGSAKPRKVTQGELMNREVLGKSLVAARDLPAGTTVAEADIAVRSPGNGLAPYRKTDLAGQVLSRALGAGEPFFASDLGRDGAKPRAYRFRRPFGLPVRYHDADALARVSNPDLLEFHLSYMDLELDPADHLTSAAYPYDLVVHAPELFAGDHVLDLASGNADYRAHSLGELARVVELTARLADRFRTSGLPRIVVNVGGFTQDGFLSPDARGVLYERVAEGLDRFKDAGVELIPQTMPPFPWHFGGQRYHNLFLDGAEIASFCRDHAMRVCLDVSHSKLACVHARASFAAFLDDVAPHAAHLHLVDAQGVDGEGLQIGEGEIDFAHLAQVLDGACPKASFVPEVWQGHKNGGEGFWIALERLEAYF